MAGDLGVDRMAGELVLKRKVLRTIYGPKSENRVFRRR
jgi:hypothetical protein